MTTADKVFKTILAKIADETGVEPKGIKHTYDEVTTLRFTVEQPLGLLTRLIKRPIDGSFKPEPGDKHLDNGVPLDLASKAVEDESLRTAYDNLLSTVQCGQLPAKTDAAYQRFSARFWHLDPCGTCAEKGVDSCWNCLGARNFDCKSCRAGRVDCSCTHGRVRCTRCNSTGKIRHTVWEPRTVTITHYNAPASFETHQFQVDTETLCGCNMGWICCTTCDGEGQLHCKASGCKCGRIRCETCGGSGETDCQPCKGSGATGVLHEGAVYLDWGERRAILPTKTSDVENVVRRALGSDSSLLRQSTITFNSVTRRDIKNSPCTFVVSQDGRLKIFRVDVEFSGKTYQVIGYGDEPSLAADGGLQSLLATRIRKERAAARDSAEQADAINRHALMKEINDLPEVQETRSASLKKLQSTLKTSMRCSYFKEEVNWLLSEPIQNAHFFSGYRINDDDHHRFRTRFMASVERIFLKLKRIYVTTVLLCIALVVGLATWLGSPLVAGIVGLFMTPIGLNNWVFRKLLDARFQGVFDSPQKSLSSFKRLLCSESVYSSTAQFNQRVFAEPGRSIRFHSIFVIVGTGVAVLVARHGKEDTLLLFKGWVLTILRWFA